MRGQRLLRHLVALSIAFGAGSASAAELAELPSEVLSDLVSEVEQSDTDTDTKLSVLKLLSSDVRGDVRASVAEAAGHLWPDNKEDSLALVRALAQDGSTKVRAAAANGLTRMLYLASPAERVEVVCTFAVADAPAERLALARALSSHVPVLVADLALEQLANDDEPEIRAAAVRAALQRIDEAPATYRRLAAERIADPDRNVRRAAKRLLGRA
ncbi:MAG TPA: hypothetical protein VM686_26720 [Polyangiaceae bacterium]|nr:hypothetical protein [Polyangiaceae bacterium]